MKKKIVGGIALFGVVMSAQAVSTAQIPVVGGMLQPILGGVAIPVVGSGAIPGVGSLPALALPGAGALPGVPSLPTSGSLPGLGSAPGLGSLPGLGALALPSADAVTVPSLLINFASLAPLTQLAPVTTTAVPAVFSVTAPIGRMVYSQPMVASFAPMVFSVVQDQIGAQAPFVLSTIVSPGGNALFSPVVDGVLIPGAISLQNSVPQVQQAFTLIPVLSFTGGVPALTALIPLP